MHSKKKEQLQKLLTFFFCLRNVINIILLNLQNHEKDDVTRPCASSAINRKDKEKYAHGKPI